VSGVRGGGGDLNWRFVSFNLLGIFIFTLVTALLIENGFAGRQPLIFLFFLLGLVLIHIFLLSVFFGRFWTQGIKRYAAANGFRIVDPGEERFIAEMRKLSAFKGLVVSTQPMMEIREKGITIFAGGYRVEYDKNREMRTEHLRIMIIPLKLKTAGTLYIRPETASDRFDSLLGKNDLDFENREFSDKYFVTADPKRLAYRFFHPGMIEVFLEHRDHYVLLKDGRLLVWGMENIGVGHALKEIVTGDIEYLRWVDRGRLFVPKLIKKIPRSLLDSIEVQPVD
jgi:hypothetical protein